ncbi:MAG: SurA N-terminal domain-containing protein [Prevotella sp.]|nr:SurA N-terminal domain-containing protein [Prevotella sp.]
MAALGKIRSKGVILIILVGLGLFAFIAGDTFRSCDSMKNANRQQVGEVLGKKVNVQDYQQLVDEYTNVIKITQGRENLTDQELNQVKDMVWNTYVQTEIVSKEASELGLTVTDQEMQNILNEGTNPMLMNTPFVNQQTGRFDANLLKNFISEYNKAQNMNSQMAEQYKSIYAFWTFIEKSLRQQVLAQKYQELLGGCLLSNPISAKMAYDNENQESSIELASFPYASINDNEVKITDADLNAKYEELKPRFKQYEETRTIKFVDYQVLPSTSDLTALNKEMNGYVTALSSADDPADVVRKSSSLVAFLDIPQTKAAFSSDIAARLDSVSVGGVYGPVENKQDNTMNIIKMVSKSELPDSIQFRAIQVVAESPEVAAQKADSIYKALQGGADFEVIAKNYGQTGEKTWITSAQYQKSNSIDADTRAYLEMLNTAAVNDTKNLQISQGNIILQVTDRRAITTKYVAAVIKKSIEFSKDTYSNAYNKFSQFVSENQNLESMEKNAANFGYKVQDYSDVRNTDHYVAGIHGTREALKWIYDAKENAVSPLYECGNNDHLLVVVMTKINKKGYRSLEDENVKNYVKGEVVNDKKAEMLMEKVNGVKDIAGAKGKGGQVTNVAQVTFAAPVFVQTTGMSEPALSGAVSATANGKFCSSAIKGNAGIYMFKVTGKNTRPTKYDEKQYEQKQRQAVLQYAGNFMQELYINAKVTDNRYLFF